MTRIAFNALVYFATIFALGFVLGALRVFWVAPRLGVFESVLVELPIMLAASWVCALQVLKRRPLNTRGAAFAMGLLAFALLMGAELLLSVTGFGQTPGQWLAAQSEPPGLTGLAGQLVFAFMPVWLWRRRM